MIDWGTLITVFAVLGMLAGFCWLVLRMVAAMIEGVARGLWVPALEADEEYKLRVYRPDRDCEYCGAPGECPARPDGLPCETGGCDQCG